MQAVEVVVRVRRPRVVAEPMAARRAVRRDRAAEEVAVAAEEVVPNLATAAAGASRRQVVAVAAGALLPRLAAGPARSGGHSCDVAPDHSGTLPCLRLGNSSRLVASMRRPATSF
jgi:hypothetical protein